MGVVLFFRGLDGTSGLSPSGLRRRGGLEEWCCGKTMSRSIKLLFYRGSRFGSVPICYIISVVLFAFVRRDIWKRAASSARANRGVERLGVLDLYIGRSRRVCKFNHSNVSTWSDLCSIETSCNYCHIESVADSIHSDSVDRLKFHTVGVPRILLSGSTRSFAVIPILDNNELYVADVHYYGVLTGPEVYPVHFRSLTDEDGALLVQIIDVVQQITKVSSLAHNSELVARLRSSISVGVIGAIMPGSYKLEIEVNFSDGSSVEPVEICRVKWFGKPSDELVPEMPGKWLGVPLVGSPFDVDVHASDVQFKQPTVPCTSASSPGRWVRLSHSRCDDETYCRGEFNASFQGDLVWVPFDCVYTILSKIDILRCFARKNLKNIWFRGGSLEREHFENLRQMFSEIESSTRGRNGESYTICIDRVALMDRNGTQCSDTVVVHYNTERVEWQDVLSDPRNLFIISEYFAGSMVESPSSVALISAVKHFFKTGSSYWSPPESGINDKLWDDRLLQKLALGRKAHIIYFGSPTIHGNDLRVLVTEKQKRQVLLNPSRAKALSDCAIEYYQVSNESAHFDDVLDSWLVTEARRDASWDGIHYHFHNGDQFKGDVSQMLLNMLLNSYCATDPNKESPV